MKAPDQENMKALCVSNIIARNIFPVEYPNINYWALFGKRSVGKDVLFTVEMSMQYTYFVLLHMWTIAIVVCLILDYLCG